MHMVHILDKFPSICKKPHDKYSKTLEMPCILIFTPRIILPYLRVERPYTLVHAYFYKHRAYKHR